MFLQKLGSALVIQRFRCHSFAQCFAFYHMGVGGPRGQRLEGFEETLDFCERVGGQKCNKKT